MYTLIKSLHSCKSHECAPSLQAVSPANNLRMLGCLSLQKVFTCRVCNKNRNWDVVVEFKARIN